MPEKPLVPEPPEAQRTIHPYRPENSFVLLLIITLHSVTQQTMQPGKMIGLVCELFRECLLQQLWLQRIYKLGLLGFLRLRTMIYRPLNGALFTALLGCPILQVRAPNTDLNGVLFRVCRGPYRVHEDPTGTPGSRTGIVGPMGPGPLPVHLLIKFSWHSCDVTCLFPWFGISTTCLTLWCLWRTWLHGGQASVIANTCFDLGRPNTTRYYIQYLHH